MEDFEKLGVFYLGKEYDLRERKIKEGLLLYDSKDLTTHGVCVGMTGSGKTGLCISLIEEAAIDNIPAILIDPKGDLSNLLLTFPNLSGEDFLPWINFDDARKKGLSAEDFASNQAETWRNGISSWGQDKSRIQKLRNAVDFMIYTPGSNAGIPVSILNSFSVPENEILNDAELVSDRVNSTVTSLLGLVGIEADPIQSREHILLSKIIDQTWKNGKDLDLAMLIQQVQSPPITKVGVLDLETFYPSKERFILMMALNNLLASPSFNSWLEGEPLAIDNFLYTSQGKPKISIFSISHLSDQERMFFVSLLLNQLLGWTRSQSGTTSLRAILYMDEIFGYLPPVENPPSKLPLLTLLKQARAFGLGILLATQNPVDIDYKALSNTGTWFIGRLQTERDKARLLDGLESIAASSGIHYNRQELEKIIAGLGSRVFMLNNTHENHPEIFHTRWALSYLRGPITRDQIKLLMDPIKPSLKTSNGTTTGDEASSLVSEKTSVQQRQVSAKTKTMEQTNIPPLPPGISSYYLPFERKPSPDDEIIYMPNLFCAVDIGYSSAKLKVDTIVEKVLLTPVTDEIIAVDWENVLELDVDPKELEKTPEKGALFTDLPPDATKKTKYTSWNKDVITWVYANERLKLMYSPSLKAISLPEETEKDFRVRLQQLAREHRDEEVDKIKAKYSKKIASLEEKIRKAEQAVDREADQAKQAGFQTAISVGATILGALTGRKTISKTNIGKATTAVRGASRSLSAKEDVKRAQETLEAYHKQLEELQLDFDKETELLADKVDLLLEEFEILEIKPKKIDINVQVFSLVWAPFSKNPQGIVTQFFRT